MNEQLNEELISAFLDGELNAEDRQRVQRAMESDPRWQRVLRESEVLRKELRDLPRYELGQDLSDQVIRLAERSLLEEQAGRGNRSGEGQGQVEPVRRRSWGWVAVGGGMAAMLAAVLLLAIQIAKPPREVAMNQPASPKQRQPVDAAPDTAAEEMSNAAEDATLGALADAPSDAEDATSGAAGRAAAQESVADRQADRSSGQPPDAVAEQPGPNGLRRTLPAPAAPEPREEPGSDAAAVAAQAALDAERKAPLSIEQAVMYFDFSAENFDAVRATLQRRDIQLSPSRAARGSLAESTPAPPDPPTEQTRVGGSELVISIPRDKLTAMVEQLAVQPGLIRRVDLPAADAAAAAGQTSRANDLAARAVERAQSGAVPPATVRLYVVVEPSAEANPVLPAGDEQGEGNK